MEWWVIKEIENSNEEELVNRQKVFLNLSRRQSEQFRSIIKQVWQNKDVVKSIVGWLGELGGAFTKGFTS